MIVIVFVYAAISAAWWIATDVHFSSQRMPISEAVYWQHSDGRKNWKAYTAQAIVALFWPVFLASAMVVKA